MSLVVDKSAWKRVAFGSVVDNVTERVDDPAKAEVERYVGLEHLDPGVSWVRRWDTPDKVEAQKLRFYPDDVIFGRRRAYQKKVARADFEGICSAHALVLRARPQLMDPEFLPVFLSSDYFLDRAISISVGSLSPTVNWRDLKVQQFDLPSLEEQKRLAMLFWAMEMHARSLSAVLEKTREVGRLFPTLAGRGSGRICRLDDVATIRNGQTFPHRLQGRTSGKYPFFKVSDLDSPGNETWLRSAQNWIDDEDVRALGARLAQPGDIVTVRVGAALRAERRRLIVRPSLVDDNQLIITPTSVDSTFLWAWLSEVELAVARNDGVVPSINQRIVGGVRIPDCGDAEQRAFARGYLQILDAGRGVRAEARELLCARTAMLREMFV